jgi:hypothetical protein
MGRACMLASTCFLSLAHNYYISTIVLKMFAYNAEPGLKTHKGPGGARNWNIEKVNQICERPPPSYET